MEDLANGLRDAFEREPRMAGPQLEDYRHVATTLGRVFEDKADGGTPAGSLA